MANWIQFYISVCNKRDRKQIHPVRMEETSKTNMLTCVLKILIFVLFLFHCRNWEVLNEKIYLHIQGVCSMV